MATIVNGIPVLIPPPEGYEVDFENPQRNAHISMYIVFGIGMVVSHAFLGQYLYVKLWLRHKLDLEIVMVILAYLTSLVTQGLLIYGFANDLIGVHAWEMPITNFMEFMRIFFITPLLFCPLVAFAKLALALFYRGLSPQTWWRWSIDSVIAFIILYNIAIFFALLFACDPIQMSWDLTIADGTCLDRPSIYVSQVSFGTASDVMLFLVPVPLVLQLRIPRAQKVGLIAIFAIGLVTLITGVVRIAMLVLPDFTSLDQTWVVPPPIIVSIAEINLLFVCATIPTLKGFFRHVAPSVFGDTKRGYGYQRTGGHSSGPYKDHTLRTIGGGPNYARRNRGEDSFVMTNVSTKNHDASVTVAQPEPAADSSSEGQGDGTGEGSRGVGENQTWDARAAARDTDAIVQTRTVTVSYSYPR
ncbi:hypothetical protein B0I35DRAFT_512840 [Stachybotrys elegans]|uniref:Rhodopsin domain-containing protein n=1 Tax=Stachybotrys elegans TaxID=80388 RepID=A0A8K0SU64_9HYPO|nr:hypothetical protein B0I35DRAFT_512840 [Stachybotrys elegans]